MHATSYPAPTWFLTRPQQSMKLRLQWEFPCLDHPGHSGDRHFCTILSEWPWTRGSVPQFLHMPKDTIYEMPMCSGDLEEPLANVTFLSLYMAGIYR